MIVKDKLIRFLVLVSLLVSQLVPSLSLAQATAVQAAPILRTDALVLVNSASSNYLDFQKFVQPYLDVYGVPYTVLDIATTAVPTNIGDYALIIIGHRSIDVNDTYLSSTEESSITAAVQAGSGLINFDENLRATNSTSRYSYVQSIFNFTYNTTTSGSNVTFINNTHYITQQHTSGQVITTGTMTLGGLVLPASGVTSLATVGSQPFMAVASYGSGRAVQWNSYDWMSNSVKGQLFGFDDLVWRSLVWASRKPFVMQGMPPFVTYRVDDVDGPMDWLTVATDAGFKPWMGFFPDGLDANETAIISNLTNSGKATGSIHAKSQDTTNFTNFFYFDHQNQTNLSDTTVAQNFAWGSQWYQANNIPISKMVVGHYYEFGSNVFSGLQNWGVEFITTQMNPGSPESGSPWMMKGPYRLYETGLARDFLHNPYYADFVDVPGHPEFAGKFFNCVSEVRDADPRTNYEWDPTGDINASVQYGTEYITRSLKAQTLATLFTHEYLFDDVTADQFRSIMAGIKQNLAPYNPQYVTLDYACQYVRATKTSDISASQYDAGTNQVSVSLTGKTDLVTEFYVYTEQNGNIVSTPADVPIFNGSTQVTYTIPGQLARVDVTPNPASVVAGSTQQFSAVGYDAANTVVPNLTFTWSVANGGGTISSTGLFTAGATPGTYTNTVKATANGIDGFATVNVTNTTIHHFAWDTITNPKYVNSPFTTTLRAMDINNNPVLSYNGTAILSASAGSISPASVTLSNGVWTGQVTLNQTATGLAISAADGSFTGASNTFDVVTMRACPCSIWTSSTLPSIADVSDGIPIEVGVKFKSDTDGLITGIRFYKGPQNTGVHTGHLWKTDGTLLASVTFTGETSSGWQQMLFSTPVAITANTTYVASYFSPTGYFADSADYFHSAIYNAPLKALAEGEDGSNGIYNYGASGYPTATWAGHAPNYWVDVVFDVGTQADTTPPTVTATNPASGATAVNTSANVTATFSEALNAATVNSTNFTLRDASNNLVAAAVSYDSATRTATLNPSADLSFSATYTATLRGGTGGIADTAGNVLTSNVSWSFTTAAVPPSLDHFGIDTIASPQYANTAFAVTVRALDATSSALTSYNGTAALSASAGTISPTSITFVNGVWTGQVTLNQAATGITITATSGAAAGTSNTFNVLAIRACPCSIWDNTATPAIMDITDNVPIELGVKFRTTTDGSITGLRFYKGPQNTGTHVGNLWAADGTLLASVTFTGETASGWQQMLFNNPVGVTANTTYIASYYSPTGYFADSAEYFHSALLNTPLKALAEGEDGANGIYNYGSSGFPTSTWAGHAPNYWVDVVFSYGTVADTTPPTVVSTDPGSGATGIEITTNVNATFNEALDPSTVTTSNFEVRNASNTLVAGAVSYNSATRTVTLNPTADLAYSTTYTALLKGGATGIADTSGNHMTSNIAWTFTTGAPPPPPPTEGPGGPVLVVYSASNPFGQYFAEILRAEGLNAFAVKEISLVDANLLASYDTVILGEMALTTTQVTTFTNWVTAGGNLIAMRPDKKLASLLGLTDQAATLSNAYLLINTTSGPGVGLVNQTIQFHGTADRYALNGATSLATLYSNDTTATTAPAVTLRSVGTSGGQAAAFTFDLARSIVYTRQGNPAWAGDERDGNTLVRSDDMFYGAKVGDVQPDWINLNKIAIPQADEQQRLLANMILTMNLDKKPLPRFWYFPRGEKAVIVMTGDDHDMNGTAPRFDTYKSQSPANCSLTDWDCIRATSYIYLNGTLSDAQAAAYTQQGFEIALHTNTNCANWTPATLQSFFTTQLGQFQAKYPSLPGPFTERTHCIAWSDWSSHATILRNYGIRLDTNYYFWPPTWVNDQPGLFTGSGMPMRFAGLDGSMIDVYQSTTQMTDESGQTYPFTAVTLMDRALGPEGYYGVFTANFHTDQASHPDSDATVNAAKTRSVPVVSARQMLEWLDGRNSSAFNNITWDGNNLSFSISIGSGANGLKVMLPAQSASQPISGLTLNGSPVTYTAETIKGVNYVTFLAGAGTYIASYGTGVPNNPPTAVNDSYNATEDTALNISAPGVLSNDTDPDGNALTAALVSGPTKGSLTLNANGSFSYTPNANLNGADSFIYAANDGKGGSAQATVTINIAPVNDAPVASAQSVTTKDSIPVAVTLTATDVDSANLTYSVVTQPAHGTLSGAAPALTYTPTAGYTGPDQFSFKANDGLLDSNTAVISITVNVANIPPVLGAIGNKTVNEQAALTFTATATDADSSVLTYSLVNAPTGAAINATSGAFAWTPTEAQGPGSYTFTVVVTDNGTPVQTASETITVTVNEVNSAPTINAISSQSVAWGSPVTFTASAADSDLPANTLSFSLTGAPAGASINASTGDFTWTPTSSQVGASTFSVVVTDNGTPALNASSSVTITVTKHTPVLTYTGGTTGQITDSTALSATLTDGGTAVSGRTVSFTVGTQTASAATGANGTAATNLQITQAAGSVTLGATFAGDTAYNAASISAQTFLITAENAQLIYNGGYFITTGSNASISVAVYDSAATGYTGANPETTNKTIGTLTNIYVTFRLYPAASCLSGTPAATRTVRASDTGTSGDGIGSASYNYRVSTETAYCVSTKITNSTGGTNAFYTGEMGDPSGQVYYTNSGRVSAGSGWINDPSGVRGNFGYVVRVTSGVPSGQFFYAYDGTYNGVSAHYIIRSSGITAATYSGTTYPMTVTLQGASSILIVSTADGSVLFSETGGQFTAVVTDTNQTPNVGNDALQLTVLSQNGTTFKSVSRTVIGAGNIRSRSQ